MCAAICSFVCRVSTSLRDGLIGCTQSQSFFNRGTVAHPAVETEIKISISIRMMSSLRKCGDGFGHCCLTFGLPGGIAGSRRRETASCRWAKGSRPASCGLLQKPLTAPNPGGEGRGHDDEGGNQGGSPQGLRQDRHDADPSRMTAWLRSLPPQPLLRLPGSRHWPHDTGNDNWRFKNRACLQSWGALCRCAALRQTAPRTVSMCGLQHIQRGSPFHADPQSPLLDD